MFVQQYDYAYKNKREGRGSEPFLFLHILTFDDHHHHTYIVHVEEYQYEVYVLKFYLKNHRLSPKKYQLITGFGCPSRVIYTCVCIMIDEFYKKRNPYASFGFIGAQLPEESEKGDHANTKRFRLYRKIMAGKISDIYFEHKEYPAKSAYLMLNRERKQTLIHIEKLFQQVYPTLS